MSRELPHDVGSLAIAMREQRFWPPFARTAGAGALDLR
jgi:hypothetical protein